jgi:elongation factor Ts
MSISATDVKQLRERTGAGMMDCKQALTEAGGDIDQAIKVLRTKGLAAAAKKAHRAASEGSVVIAGDASCMVVLELNCETDFVARNPRFQEFAAALVNQALQAGAATPEALAQQRFAPEPELTVEQAISQLVATIGENIVVSRLARIEAGAGSKLASYIHGGGKIGVAVEGTSQVPDQALHDVALHVAASEPRFVSRGEVTADVLQTEREIALKQVIAQGKPEQIAQKIVVGKMEKFFEHAVLLEQPFAKDPSRSVAQYLSGAGGDGATVLRFVRFRLGEVAG